VLLDSINDAHETAGMNPGPLCIKSCALTITESWLELTTYTLRYTAKVNSNVQNLEFTVSAWLSFSKTAQSTQSQTFLTKQIAQFAITCTINSNVCPHIRVPNMLMTESYA